MSAKTGEEKLYVATVGSKMRVCLPPNASEHVNIKQGDFITLIPDEFEGVPFLRLHPVKKENFKISDKKRADIINDSGKIH